jgi:hypothetical protein
MFQLNQEMQEERLNRDANEMAIAALGGAPRDTNDSTMTSANLDNQVNSSIKFVDFMFFRIRDREDVELICVIFCACWTARIRQKVL